MVLVAMDMLNEALQTVDHPYSQTSTINAQLIERGSTRTGK